MKKTIQILNILLLTTVILSAGNIELQGLVRDGITHEPLQGVNIVARPGGNGSASDSRGHFRLSLSPAAHTLVISHIGYRTRYVTVNPGETERMLRIDLQPSVIERKQAITVYGAAVDPLDKNRDKWLNSTDDMMTRFEGVTLMRRANFALEPTIRGLSYGQISTTIDGMKIFHACVDRMDPATSYVEVENLDRLEVSKGAYDLSQSSVGGALNFITRDPQRRPGWSSESETGFESASALRRLRGELSWRGDNQALRFSMSLKKADSYYAGNHTRIARSGYNKQNGALKYQIQVNENNRLTLNYIGDFAQDIGYPALLMDATKTIAHIGSIKYELTPGKRWFPKFDVRMYYNKIRHWMDDYGRDVRNREVMADMYMPMYGDATTYGAIFRATFLPGGESVLNVSLDYYRLNSFADMKMLSIFPDVAPAYIINIADARLDNLALIADYNTLLTEHWRLRGNLRLDYARRDIYNAFGKNALSAFWSDQNSAMKAVLPSASLALERRINRDNILTWSLAAVQRMPSHMESYSFFIYNLLDGYFYTGNPGLKPETSLQTDIGWQYRGSSLASDLSLFYNHLNNYIAGRLQSEEFKIYENFTGADLYGFEWNGAYTVKALTLGGSLTYTRGENTALGEPLPYIPPLAAGVSLSYNAAKWWLQGRLLYNAAQNRIAYKSTREDKTAAFTRLDIRGRYHLSEAWEFRAGVENLLDRYYHEHLSINNLPSPGRNFYLGLNYHWQTSR